jgi:hypothetical protein
VSPEFVEHHYLPLRELRSQKMLNVKLESFGVCGPLDAHRLSHPIQTHRSH